MHQSDIQLTSATTVSPETSPETSQEAHRHDLPSSRRLIVFTAILIMMSVALGSATAQEQIVRSMSEIESGTLLFLSDEKSHYQRAPLVDTSVKISVQGLLARTEVAQTFSNDSTDWMEGIYAFPLPDNATVDTLTMIVGDTTIEGEIQPRQKARANYETAKVSGKKASLVEQQRPNLFTTRVANIPPGESITISIGYQSAVRYVDGRFDLYFPLTITPRYVPAKSLSYDKNELSATQSGWTTIEQLQDASEITPPMTEIASEVSLSVTLDTGLQDLTINSSTHDIIASMNDSTSNDIWEVVLANQTIKADRDFKLSWTPKISTAPVAAVFRQDKNSEQGDIESFASIMIMPPQQIFSESTPSREVIFVIDTSQSMGGNSIRQARRMLALGIERLSSEDSFNVIAFNNTTRRFFNY